jgi:hypothetical protein
MKTTKHALRFITEFKDETDPTAQRILKMSKTERVQLLEKVLREELEPLIQSKLDELNKNNSWAILRLENKND